MGTLTPQPGGVTEDVDDGSLSSTLPSSGGVTEDVPDADPEPQPTGPGHLSLSQALTPVSGEERARAIMGTGDKSSTTPVSDFGEWVGNKVDAAAAGVLNTIPRALTFGHWQPFTPQPASPGAQRVSKEIDDLTGKTELDEAMQDPKKRAAIEASSLRPAYMDSPIAQRAAQEVMDVGTIAGGIEGFARTPELPPETPLATPAAKPSYAQRVGEEPAPTAAPAVPSTAGSRQSVGAAQANAGPGYTLTGQENARGPFPQVKLAKNAGDVSTDEQATRANIAREVLDDTHSGAGVRTGVVTGNEQTLRSEYQAAKNPDQGEANQLMAGQIAAEQTALPQFAQQRIEATGADPTLDSDYKRGEAINNAFFGDGSLNDYFTQEKQRVYLSALEKNGGNKIETPATDALLTDPQFAAGTQLAKNEGVVNGAKTLIDLAKNTGFKDPITGAQYAPGSVAAYNAVTKAINKGWSRENAFTIGQINDAINADIAASGGGELYAQGNAIHQLHRSLMSDSPGIKKVFGDVDPNGVQTGKPFETIPNSLNNMPLDQWRHVHDTLDNLSRGQIRGAVPGMGAVPSDLQTAAARAKAEMEGALAREVYAKGAGKAGEWNANAVNNTLNGSVGQKIVDSFSPREVDKFHTLNSAGQIMPGRHPYEGAGAQTARLEAEPGFLEEHYEPAAAFLGAHIPHAGPFGPYLLGKVGRGLGNWSKAQRQAAAANRVRASLLHNRTPSSTVSPDMIPARAAGGKVDHEALVNQLMRRWHTARRHANSTTELLLNLPDETVTKALRIANGRATI